MAVTDVRTQLHNSGNSRLNFTRRLNTESIPTRKESARWERSTVWAVLRNPAYRGVACFGQTRVSSRTRVIRPQRRRGVTTPSMTAGTNALAQQSVPATVRAGVEETWARGALESVHRELRR